MPMIYKAADNEDELSQILALQQENMRLSKSPEVEQEQGFVTLQHDMDLLKEMNSYASHIIAKDGEKVAGYALAMTKDFKELIPGLIPMFNLMDSITVDGQLMSKFEYLVMGQVCVDIDYRGTGVFKGMYEYYFDYHKSKYEYVITDIAARNVRSIKAHFNVGFKEIHRFVEEGFEEWVVVAVAI
ncbi:MAG: GNAT family N-acetyltransferase [Saprospiraceae bacterium]